MSNALLTQAWEVCDTSPTQKIVLVNLANRADSNGKCFPGHRLISKECSISIRTVQSAVDALESKGHITAVRRTHRSAKGDSVYDYTVHPSTPAPVAGVTPATGRCDTGNQCNGHRQMRVATPANDDHPIILTNKNLLDNQDNQLTDLTTLKLAHCYEIARDILSNKDGWSYDNCKVQPSHFPYAKSLATVMREFVGRVKMSEVRIAWNKAVSATHAADVDGMVIDIPRHVIGCWKELLGKIANVKANGPN